MSDFVDGHGRAVFGGSELAVDQPHDLFTQIDRIMKINELSVVTNDVIAAARSTLVIGEP